MKYVTNFARTCFSHWTASKAVMEFVQNFLDSEGQRDFEFGDNYIVLTNKNIKVSNKLLMMGKSDKREDDSKRGRFGVGSIQAMVVLIDIGYEVEIQNNDVIWTPTWEYSDQFGEDVMVIQERQASNPTNHFTVTITGLEEVDIDEIKQRSLIFQDREVLYTSKYGDIIANPVDGNGEVYVGDIYVCQNGGFRYSYNFHPSIIRLCQDRNVVSEWDLQQVTAKLIVSTGDKDFIQEAILANALDTRAINAYSWEKSQHTPEDVDNSFAEKFLEEHGSVLVTSDYDEHKQNESLGNVSVYIPNERQVKAIQRSELYQEAIANIEVKEKERFSDLMDKLLEEVENVLCAGVVSRSEYPELQELVDRVRERVYNSDYE